MKNKKALLNEYNQQTILAAAKVLFENIGFTETKMDEIAKKAECSKSTIYVYFKSKDEIYAAIILEYMLLLRDALQQKITEMTDFEDCYFSICEMLADFEEEYPLYFASIMGEIDVSKKALLKNSLLEKIYNCGEEINQLMLGYFEQGVAQNKIAAGSADILTMFVLYSSISSLIITSRNKQNYLQRHKGITKKEFQHHGFELILRMLLRTES